MRLSLKMLMLLCVAGILTGCASLLGLNRETELSREHAALSGVIASETKQTGSIVVTAYTTAEGQVRIEDYTILHEPGSYELLVKEGRYRLMAFVDVNRDLVFDLGEPYGLYRHGDRIGAEKAETIWGLDFVVNDTDPASDSDHLDLPRSTAIAPKEKAVYQSTLAGAIIDMDDPVFSTESGQRAYWQPIEFFKDYNGNIYFLEPYDPNRIPVLFVHGAGGSPQDWRCLLDGLDRSKYQPWVYFYPSGLSIGASALLLTKKIDDLGTKYNFDRLYLVAHSMGGLVTRSTLVDFGYEYLPYVKLFVSISTPWGGEETARSAVDHNVLMVPAWKDMVPDSLFINHIFKKPIPDRIEYYLLFSHRGRGASFRGNTDGAVTLASQLDSRAQKESIRTVGFDEDHDSILCSKEVAEQLNAIFLDVDQRAGKRPERIPVKVTLHHPDEPPLPQQMYLWLLPEDSRGRDSVITLTPHPSEQLVVKIAPGVYQVGLVVSGFASSPQSAPLTVTAGKDVETSFDLRPEGQIYGYIGSPLAQEEIYTGTDQQPDENIHIERIRLEGNNISREMDSTDYTDEGIYQAWIKNKDYLDKASNSFIFFNLPAGDYSLEIQAEGYELYRGKYHVVPGQLEPTKALWLTPKKK